MKKNWFAAHVKLYHETKICENLQKMGIESYVPVRRELRVWHDRRVFKNRVLTPQLIFLRGDEKERRAALELDSVLFYICPPGIHAPAHIPDNQMEQFIFFVTNANAEITFSNDHLELGDHVRIVLGPLTGMEGTVVNHKGKNCFAIQIDLLGCAMMEITPDMIEKIVG